MLQHLRLMRVVELVVLDLPDWSNLLKLLARVEHNGLPGMLCQRPIKYRV